MTNQDAQQNSAMEAQAVPQSESDQSKGIGGWLGIPAAALIFVPLLLYGNINQTNELIKSYDATIHRHVLSEIPKHNFKYKGEPDTIEWEATYIMAMSFIGDTIDPLNREKSYFIFEYRRLVFILASALILALLFFSHHRWTPKLYIGFLTMVLLSGLYSASYSKEVFGSRIPDQEVFNTVLLLFAMWCIGVPYFVHSQKVKNTFTRRWGL